MAKPNYQFEKRQRDLKKKQKQEAKRQKKLAAKQSAREGAQDSSAEPLDPARTDERGDAPPPSDPQP